MKFFIDILKGMVIGLANIIPGVSGGTMMVSMGIYDTLIYCITHLFKQFKKSLMTLLPFVVGMIAALAILSNVITWALMDEFASLPTNTLFIGLILGARDHENVSIAVHTSVAFAIVAGLVLTLIGVLLTTTPAPTKTP